jgi:ATP-dependent DNA helicase RecG
MNNLKFNTNNFKLKLYASGIARIKDECRSHGVIAPRFEEFVHGFMVTLYKEKPHAPLNSPVNAPVNELQIKILKCIKSDSKISYDELSSKLGKNRTTIMRNIKKLKEQNLLKRVGSDKAGYWEVQDERQ